MSSFWDPMRLKVAAVVTFYMVSALTVRPLHLPMLALTPADGLCVGSTLLAAGGY